MSKPTKNALKIRAEDLDSDDVDAEQETDLDDDQSSTQSADKKPSTKPTSPKEKGEDLLARLVPTPPKKSKTIKLSSSSSVVKEKLDESDTAHLPPPKTPSEQMAQGPDGLLAAAHFGPQMEESLDDRVPVSNIVIGHRMAKALLEQLGKLDFFKETLMPPPKFKKNATPKQVNKAWDAYAKSQDKFIASMEDKHAMCVTLAEYLLKMPVDVESDDEDDQGIPGLSKDFKDLGNSFDVVHSLAQELLDNQAKFKCEADRCYKTGDERLKNLTAETHENIKSIVDTCENIAQLTASGEANVRSILTLSVNTNRDLTAFLALPHNTANYGAHSSVMAPNHQVGVQHVTELQQRDLRLIRDNECSAHNTRQRTFVNRHILKKGSVYDLLLTSLADNQDVYYIHLRELLPNWESLEFVPIHGLESGHNSNLCGVNLLKHEGLVNDGPALLSQILVALQERQRLCRRYTTECTNTYPIRRGAAPAEWGSKTPRCPNGGGYFPIHFNEFNQFWGAEGTAKNQLAAAKRDRLVNPTMNRCQAKAIFDVRSFVAGIPLCKAIAEITDPPDRRCVRYVTIDAIHMRIALLALCKKIKESRTRLGRERSRDQQLSEIRAKRKHNEISRTLSAAAPTLNSAQKFDGCITVAKRDENERSAKRKSEQAPPSKQPKRSKEERMEKRAERNLSDTDDEVVAVLPADNASDTTSDEEVNYCASSEEENPTMVLPSLGLFLSQLESENGRIHDLALASKNPALSQKHWRKGLKAQLQHEIRVHNSNDTELKNFLPSKASRDGINTVTLLNYNANIQDLLVEASKN